MSPRLLTAAWANPSRSRGQIAGKPEAIRMSGKSPYAVVGETRVGGNCFLPVPQH